MSADPNDTGSVPTGPLHGPWSITSPAVIEGMSDADYHRDPVPGGSLSHSAVKLLREAPAKFHHHQTHPRPPKREFDFGHAAHGLILGTGDPVEIVDAGDWRTKAAQEAAAQARAAGRVPLLAHEWAHVEGMAAALASGPAARLFRPSTGMSEVVVVWMDTDTGLWLRAKFDRVLIGADGSVTIIDYKSAKNSSPAAFARAMWEYGYYTQDAFYSTGAEVLGLGDPVRFLFVVQEKDPPYLCTVVELDEEDRQWGRVVNRRALHDYLRYRAADHWPGYAEDIVSVGLPAYGRRTLSDAWDSGTLRVEEDR